MNANKEKHMKRIRCVGATIVAIIIFSGPSAKCPAYGSDARVLRRTSNDKDHYLAVLNVGTNVDSIAYISRKSMFINGAIREESRQRVIQSRSQEIMRVENVVFDVNGVEGERLIMIYDAGAGYYVQGKKRARVVLDECVRMRDDLVRQIPPERQINRFEYVKVQAPVLAGGDIEVFAKYDLVKTPGLWTSVWVDKRIGMEVLSVVYSEMGMLSLTELQVIAVNKPVDRATIYSGLEGIENQNLPELSLVEFLDGGDGS